MMLQLSWEIQIQEFQKENSDRWVKSKFSSKVRQKLVKYFTGFWKEYLKIKKERPVFKVVGR